VQPVLLDSSVYIDAFRAKGNGSRFLNRFRERAPVWLSSVVLEELYAGASGRDRSRVERIERDFDRVGRILVPNLSDWIQTGRVLSLVAAKHGFVRIGQGRLTNDALIALSAGRAGITVLTANARDFGKLAEFRPFRWRIVNTAAVEQNETLNDIS